MTKRRTVAALLALAAGTAAALGFAHRSGASTASGANGDVAAAVRAVGGPLVGGEITGDAVRVVGTGANIAEATRAQWYGGLAGALVAARSGGVARVEMVAEANGEPFVEAAAFNDRAAAAAASRRGSDELGGVRARAAALGVRVVQARVVPVFGGALHVTLAADDPARFVATAATAVATVLGAAAGEGRAYFVTVTDRRGDPKLVLGYNPAVGGSLGQGSAWIDPALETDAIWGAPAVAP